MTRAVLLLVVALAHTAEARPLFRNTSVSVTPGMATAAVRCALAVVADRCRSQPIGPFVVCEPLPSFSAPTTMAPTALVDPEIDAAEQMAMNAVGPSGLLSRWANTPQDVDPMSNRLQMPRVTTCSIAAEVIEHGPRGNWTDQCFVGSAMGLGHASLPLAMTIAGLCVNEPWVGPAYIALVEHHGDVSREDGLVGQSHDARYLRAALRATGAG